MNTVSGPKQELPTYVAYKLVYLLSMTLEYGVKEHVLARLINQQGCCQGLKKKTNIWAALSKRIKPKICMLVAEKEETELDYT